MNVSEEDLCLHWEAKVGEGSSGGLRIVICESPVVYERF